MAADPEQSEYAEPGHVQLLSVPLRAPGAAHPYVEPPCALRLQPPAHEQAPAQHQPRPCPANAPFNPATDCAYNSTFQDLTDHLDEVQRLDPRAFEALANLSRDFGSCASLWARTIITERSLPASHTGLRMIPPTALGGFAGGDKYIAHGILFKLATNRHAVYSSVDAAAKEAGHNLRSTTALFAADTGSNLRLPMTMLVDWLGWRLTAMALLPIEPKQSLVHGSADGARVFHNSDQEAARALATATRALNLAPHYVASHHAAAQYNEAFTAGYLPCDPSTLYSDADCTTPHPLPADTASAGLVLQQPRVDLRHAVTVAYGPVDLEVHRSAKSAGGDGRLYALDLARLFPPEPPAMHSARSVSPIRSPGSGYVEATLAQGQVVRGGHLIQLLRPELVLQSPVPLSSDAHTRFGAVGSATFNAHVQDVFTDMLQRVIPDLALALDERWRAQESAGRELRALELVVYPCDRTEDGDLLHRPDIRARATERMLQRGIHMFQEATHNSQHGGSSARHGVAGVRVNVLRSGRSSREQAGTPARPRAPTGGSVHSSPERATCPTAPRLALPVREPGFPSVNACAALVASAHVHGVNVRHLGRVCGVAQEQRVRQMIVTECMARVLKVLLAQRWRAVRADAGQALGQLTPYRAAAVAFLNEVLPYLARTELAPPAHCSGAYASDAGSMSTCSSPLPGTDSRQSCSSVPSTPIPPPPELRTLLDSSFGHSTTVESRMAAVWADIARLMLDKYGIALDVPGTGSTSVDSGTSTESRGSSTVVHIGAVPGARLARCICPLALMRRFADLSGVQLTHSAWTALQRAGDNFLAQRAPFHDSHIASLEPRLKATPLLQYASAMAQGLRCRRMRDALGWEDQQAMAEAAFENLILCAPAYGPGLAACAHFLHDSGQHDLAAVMQLRACTTNPRHFRSMYYTGLYLKECMAQARHTRADPTRYGQAVLGYLMRALELGGDSANVLKDIANVYRFSKSRQKHKLEDVEQVVRYFLAALAVSPLHSRSLVNLAVFVQPGDGLLNCLTLKHINAVAHPHQLSSLKEYLLTLRTNLFSLSARRKQLQAAPPDDAEEPSEATPSDSPDTLLTSLHAAVARTARAWQGTTREDELAALASAAAGQLQQLLPRASPQTQACLCAVLPYAAVMRTPAWLLDAEMRQLHATLWLAQTVASVNELFEEVRHLKEKRTPLFSPAVVSAVQAVHLYKPSLPLDLRKVPGVLPAALAYNQHALGTQQMLPDAMLPTPPSPATKSASWFSNVHRNAGPALHELHALVAKLHDFRPADEGCARSVSLLAAQLRRSAAVQQAAKVAGGQHDLLQLDVDGVMVLCADMARDWQRLYDKAKADDPQRAAYMSHALQLAAWSMELCCAQDKRRPLHLQDGHARLAEVDTELEGLWGLAKRLAAAGREHTARWDNQAGAARKNIFIAIKPGASRELWFTLLCQTWVWLLHRASHGWASLDSVHSQANTLDKRRNPTYQLHVTAGRVRAHLRMQCSRPIRANVHRAAVEVCCTIAAAHGSPEHALPAAPRDIIVDCALPNVGLALANWRLHVEVDELPEQAQAHTPRSPPQARVSMEDMVHDMGKLLENLRNAASSNSLGCSAALPALAQRVGAWSGMGSVRLTRAVLRLMQQGFSKTPGIWLPNGNTTRAARGTGLAAAVLALAAGASEDAVAPLLRGGGSAGRVAAQLWHAPHAAPNQNFSRAVDTNWAEARARASTPRGWGAASPAASSQPSTASVEFPSLGR